MYNLFQYQVTAKPVFTPVSTVNIDSWFAALSAPLRKTALSVAVVATTGVAGPVGFIPPDIGLASTAWAQPVTQRRQTPYQTHAFVSTVSAEIVTVDKWYAAWREPVRQLPALRTGAQQFTAFVQASPFTEATFESKWHYAWSEPIVKTKISLAPAGQQALAWSGFTPADVASEDKWHQPWSTPTLRIPSPANQQATAFVKSAPFGETILESEWHYAWSEPVRQKQGLAAYLQIAPDYWSTFTPPVENVTVDKWYIALSNPPKAKVSLAPASQQYTAMVPFALPYAIVSFGWNSPQTQLAPTRKFWLGAHQHPFITRPLQPLANPISITGVLAATETRDTFQAGGITYSAPFDALVGIIEMSLESDPVAIVSIRQI